MHDVAFHLGGAPVVRFNAHTLGDSAQIVRGVVVERFAGDQILHSLGKTDNVLLRSAATDQTRQARTCRHDFQNVAPTVAIEFLSVEPIGPALKFRRLT